MNHPSLDIIIVNFKSTSYLIDCLRSVFESREDVTISKIFVQDNKTDDDINSIRDLFPQVHLTRNEMNIGFAAGINQGIKLSRSKYLLLLNPDTIILDNFFSPMLDFMEKQPDVGIIGPRILDSDGKIQGSARAFPNALTALYGRSSPLTRYFPNNPISRGNIMTIGSDGKTPLKVDWVSGACMLVRRETVEETGLMDEKFFMYWEDADWCKRMKDDGWKIIYFPQVSIYHHIGKSSDKRPFPSIYHFHRSSYLLHEKYTKIPLSLFNPIVLLMLSFRCGLVALFRILRKKEIRTKKQEVKRSYLIPSRRRTSRKQFIYKKNSVLHIITRLIVGGAQENTLLTAELINHKKLWDVRVLTGPQTGPEGSLIDYARDNSIPITIENSLVREINPLKDIWSFVKLSRFIKQGRYAVVHTHSSKAGILGRWAAWVARIPIIIHTVHGWSFHDHQHILIQTLFKILEKITLIITDKLIVVTKQDIIKGKNAGITGNGIYELIRSGIDLERFKNPTKTKKQIRQELGLPQDAIVVGTVTRLSPQKAPLIFIKAAQQVSQEDEKAHFIVVGDGPLRKDAEKLVDSLKLGNRFVFTGIRMDVMNILESFDIFALSSLWEGLPRVIPQAMASGLPVIASAIDGNREIIEDYINGRLFPPGDHIKLADAILDLIEDPDLARSLGNKGKEDIEEYDVDRMIQKISDLYDRQTASKNPSIKEQ